MGGPKNNPGTKGSDDWLDGDAAAAASQSDTGATGPAVSVRASMTSPKAVNDTAAATARQPVSGNVLTNDSDPNGGMLRVTSVGFASGATVAVPSSGTATVVADGGQLTIDAAGNYAFLDTTPTGAGALPFTYTVANSDGLTASAQLAVSVAASAPAAQLSFAFAFTSATVRFLPGATLLTGPDGTVTDVTGVGTLTFSDGTIQERATATSQGDASGEPLVDPLFYYAQNPDVWASYVQGGLDAGQHYAQFGWHEGRDPDALFSTKGYLAANPDVAQAGVDPALHYDQHGWQEGRAGVPGFSAEEYRAVNPDVAAAGVDPLQHYITYGEGEGRYAFAGLDAKGLVGDFDPQFYLQHNPDVAAAVPQGQTAASFALQHYLQYGWKEGRDPDAYFSTKGYLAANPDVAQAGVDPLLHYEQFGWREGRDPGPGFSTDAYLDHYPDVAAAHTDPLQHYLDYGISEGRQATTVVPPTVAGLLPATDTGASSTDGNTANRAPTLVGTALPGSTVQVSAVQDGVTVPLGSATATADGSWTLTLAPLPDGAYSLSAVDTDYGVTSAPSAAFQLTIDTVAPGAPALDVPPNGATVLTGTAEPGSTVQVFDGRTLLGAAAAASGTGRFTLQAALPAGANSLTATATDLAGNAGAASVPLVAYEGAAPVLSAGLAHDTGASAADGTTNDDTVAGTVSAPAVLASLTGALDGGAASDLSALVGPGGSFQLSPSVLARLAGGSLADGAHTLALTATDHAGQASAASVSFTLVTAPPPAPAASLAPAYQRGTGAAPAATAGTVSLTGVTGAGDSVVLTEPGSAPLATTAAADGSFGFAGVPIALGTNTLTVTATDLAGNSNTAVTTVQGLAPPASGNLVLQWIATARAAVTQDATVAPTAARALAMESLAIYDALQAAEGKQGYLVTVSAPADADPQAAVAAAADAMLDLLYPAQTAKFDAQLAAELAGIPDGQAKADGVQLGQTVAQRIFALRANDGSAAYVTYVGNDAPGQWRPTGPSYTPGLAPQYANVTPFALQSPGQFLPASGPPALDSAAYAQALNQVESLGARDSTTRTADETQIAKFWNDQTGTDTPPGQWNQVAATLAQSDGLGLDQAAKLFAELDVAEADAGIAAWNSKYTYDNWRPITAIQDADQDGNAATTADPNWQPLLTTPNFPDYAEGHGSFSGAAATVLASFFGDATGFTATSESLPGVTRSYTSFSQAAEEAAESRIYGGIHFQFSADAALTQGDQVGQWTLQAFGAGASSAPARISLDQPAAVTVRTPPAITGQVSAGASLQVSYDDGGSFTAVALDAYGRFAVTPALTDGGADGARTVIFAATNAAGQTALQSYTFTLAAHAPTITLDPGSLQDHGVLSAGSVLSGSVAPSSDTSLASLTYSLDGGTAMPVAFGARDAFATGIDLFAAGAGGHTLVLTATDAAGNVSSDTLNLTLAAPVPFVVASLTPAADQTEVGVTFRPRVTFSRAVDPATLTNQSFYATDPSGAVVPTTIVPLEGGTGAWLLFPQGMPGASTITLHLDGAVIRAADGTALQTAGYAATGTQLLQAFQTVSTAVVPGTSITGIVVDPGADNTPLTPDDVSSTTGSSADFAHDTWKLPLAGVKVYVLGHEDQYVLTDATGHFTLTNVPAGDVKLAVDGRTATNAPAGFFFPEMVMDLRVRPGVANTVGSALGAQDVKVAEQGNPSVYLPRVRTDIFQKLSATQPTVVHAPADTAGASGLNLSAQQIGELSLTVQPGSLLDANGNPVANPVVGISPVPTALVKDMLPPGLEQHTFDITIQAPGGAIFTTPATLTMPNVFGLAPGEKTYMLSFNHTTGRLEVDGTGTVSADGLTVTSDPGSGVIQPGWHGYTDPRSQTKAKVVVKDPTTGIKEVKYLDTKQAQQDAFDIDNVVNTVTSNAGTVGNTVNGTDLGARQFEHEFAKTTAEVTGRFAPIGLGIDGVVLAGDTYQSYKDLKTASQTGSLSDGVACVEDGVKVTLDTAITSLDYATLPGAAATATGIGAGPGAVEAVAAQGLKDVLNVLSLSITTADYLYAKAGDWVANHENAGNKDALGPKFDPTLVLHVAEDAWQGDATITVSIDGQQVLGPTRITASHAAGRVQDIAITGILGSDYHDVTVTLSNPDAGGALSQQRNAYVTGATFNGVDYAFSTPLFGITGARATANFEVGSTVDPVQTAADTAFATAMNEWALESAVFTREKDALTAIQPVLGKYDPSQPYGGLTQQDVQSYLPQFKAYLDSAALLGGHPTTGALIDSTVQASDVAISDLLSENFVPYNPPPADIPALTAQQAADRNAAFAAGRPYTQTWYAPPHGVVAVSVGGGGHVGTGSSTSNVEESYTFYPPGSGQGQLGKQVFAALTAPDGSVQRFAFDPTVGIDRLLAPNTAYKLDVFDAVTGDTGSATFTTGASGVGTDVPSVALVNTGGTALADGLTAQEAFVIGVDGTIYDNLVPGMTDLAALQQGLFDDKGLPTAGGLQASVALNGQANAVVLAGLPSTSGGGAQQLAFVATGSYGLAVVDVTNPRSPVVLSQLQLPGTATDVAVDTASGLALVADGTGGLVSVDVSNLAAPVVLRSIPGAFSHVTLYEGLAYASAGSSLAAIDPRSGLTVQAPPGTAARCTPWTAARR